MEQLTHFLSTPAGILAALFGALLILYFILKKLVKLALVVVLILFCMAGYHYFKDPATMPQKMKKTLEDAKVKTESAVAKGKSAYRQGRQIYEKGKDLSRAVDKLTEKPQPQPPPGQK